MIYIGLMSGTSVDGIDAALVDFSNKKPALIGSLYTPFSDQLRKEITTLVTTDPGVSLVARADHQLGLAFANSAIKLLEKCSIKKHECIAIGSHGQTIFHQPDKEFPTSIQIGDPNIIAENTGITTIADFRRRDMAAGGQGAPLAPAFHEFIFRKQESDRIVLNIGGIANITILPGNKNHDTSGFDCGPGNTLMDIWSKKEKHKNFDKNGAWAASGSVNEALLADLLADQYFQKQPPKSTGREYFNLAWLENILKSQPSLDAAEVQTSLCELTARCCVEEIVKQAPATQEVLVCGGGAHNKYLMTRLTELLSEKLSECQLKKTSAYGIDPDWVEATAFAWMAKQTMENLPSNLPGVTGASHPVILGGVYKR